MSLGRLGLFLWPRIGVLSLERLDHETLADGPSRDLDALGRAVDDRCHALKVGLESPAGAGSYLRTDPTQVLGPTTMAQLVALLCADSGEVADAWPQKQAQSA